MCGLAIGLPVSSVLVAGCDAALVAGLAFFTFFWITGLVLSTALACEAEELTVAVLVPAVEPPVVGAVAALARPMEAMVMAEIRAAARTRVMGAVSFVSSGRATSASAWLKYRSALPLQPVNKRQCF